MNKYWLYEVPSLRKHGELLLEGWAPDWKKAAKTGKGFFLKLPELIKQAPAGKITKQWFDAATKQHVSNREMEHFAEHTANLFKTNQVEDKEHILSTLGKVKDPFSVTQYKADLTTDDMLNHDFLSDPVLHVPVKGGGAKRKEYVDTLQDISTTRYPEHNTTRRAIRDISTTAAVINPLMRMNPATGKRNYFDASPIKKAIFHDNLEYINAPLISDNIDASKGSHEQTYTEDNFKNLEKHKTVNSLMSFGEHFSDVSELIDQDSRDSTLEDKTHYEGTQSLGALLGYGAGHTKELLGAFGAHPSAFSGLTKVHGLAQEINSSKSESVAVSAFPKAKWERAFTHQMFHLDANGKNVHIPFKNYTEHLADSDATAKSDFEPEVTPHFTGRDYHIDQESFPEHATDNYMTGSTLSSAKHGLSKEDADVELSSNGYAGTVKGVKHGNPEFNVITSDFVHEGKKHLFVHEIQSDFHQKTRGTRYEGSTPFAKNWPQKGVEYAFAHAKNNGYDRVVFSPGSHQYVNQRPNLDVDDYRNATNPDHTDLTKHDQYTLSTSEAKLGQFYDRTIIPHATKVAGHAPTMSEFSIASARGRGKEITHSMPTYDVSKVPDVERPYF